MVEDVKAKDAELPEETARHRPRHDHTPQADLESDPQAPGRASTAGV